MDIATRLDHAMRANGIKDQSELSRKTGISTSTINRILSGKLKSPNAFDAVTLAKATGVSTDWLITGNDDPNQADAIRAELISRSEAELLALVRQLSKPARDLVLSTVRARLRDESQ